MSVSYEFAVGSIKAKERTLLSAQDIELLLAAPDEDALLALLRDKGYRGTTLAQMLDAQTADTWQYVFGLVEDTSVFAPLLLQNDLHNIKVILKARLTGREDTNLLLAPTSVSVDLLREAVKANRFDRLPEWMADAAKEAYRVLAEDNDARLADAMLDRAAMAQMLAQSASLTENVKAYFQTLVFFSNVKVALRAARTGTTPAYLQAALCPVEGMDEARWISAACEDTDTLTDVLSGISAYGCRDAMDAFKTSASAFEKAVDDILIANMRQARFGVDGVDTLYGYVLARQAENKVVHIIASGVRTGTDARERVRHLHG